MFNISFIISDFFCWKVKNSEHHLLTCVSTNLFQGQTDTCCCYMHCVIREDCVFSLFACPYCAAFAIIIHKIMSVVLAWVAHDVMCESKIVNFGLSFPFLIMHAFSSLHHTGYVWVWCASLDLCLHTIQDQLGISCS